MRTLCSPINARERVITDSAGNTELNDYWEEYLDQNSKKLLEGFDACISAMGDMFINLDKYGINVDQDIINHLRPGDPGYIGMENYSQEEFANLPSNTAVALIYKHIIFDWLEFIRNDMVMEMFNSMPPEKRKKLRKS